MLALMFKKMNKAVAAFLLLSFGVLIGGVWAFITPKPNEPQTIEWLQTPRSLANFSLESESGEFNKQSLLGRWTIISFGFLTCPDVCPTSLLELSILADSLGGEPIKNDIAFIFVSVDPSRDSIDSISQFVKYFDPTFIGITGEKEALIQLAGGLSIQFKVSPNEHKYTVSHSTTFSIIDPKGNFRGRFRPGFDVDSLAINFKKFIIQTSDFR